jgi:hypothetical protein
VNYRWLHLPVHILETLLIIVDTVLSGGIESAYYGLKRRKRALPGAK